MNWDQLVLANNPLYCFLVAGISIVLFGVLTWFTLRQENSKRPGLRVTMLLVAVISLSLISLQPKWQVLKKINQAILVTPGTTLNDLQIFTDSTQFAHSVFSLDTSRNWQRLFKNVTTIPDLAFLKRHFPEIQFLHVFGFGLPQQEWQKWQDLKIQFHPSLPQAGIKNITWPRTLHLGQPLQIQGSLTDLNSQKNVLYLSGPGGKIDSLSMNSGENIRFQFTTLPRDSGRILYALSLKTSNNQILFEEKIGVSVRFVSPFKLLVLEYFPGFEIKYLKNWLAANRYSVAIHSNLTQGRYRTEFINQPELNLNQITAKLLNKFDLVIADSRVLTNLSIVELKVLNEQITGEGLSLLIMPDQSLLRKKTTRNRRVH